MYGEPVRGVVESTNTRYCGVAWRVLGLVGRRTHPFHPLRGRRLDVLQTRRWGASRMYVCDGGLLGSVVLSEEATDRGPEAAQRPLTLEVLAGLAVLVADLAGERGVAR